MNNDETEELYRLYRFDCLGDKNGEFEIIEFNHDTYIVHPQINFEVGNLKVQLSPFFWNGCEIHYQEEIKTYSPLIEWGKKWIDIDDEKTATEKQGSGNVIHNVQPPSKDLNGYMITIDFGTASINSIIELFTVFKDMGIHEIEINSNSMTNE
jgi:hypothetical protein